MSRADPGPADADEEVAGRLVVDGKVVSGRIVVRGGTIDEVAVDERAGAGGPILTPGFVDVHVHGWGGFAAWGGREALDGMARALLRRGVTSFLPTAVTAPLDALEQFADEVRAWSRDASPEGAEPLGFNLEGPFIAESKKGAQNPAFIQLPSGADRSRLENLLDGLGIITMAPEVDGAAELIRWFAERGVAVSLGHSSATLGEATAGYAAGARTTTHLFNAMTGVDHHAPGLAVAALTDDDVYVELIADGFHVDRSLWPIIFRTKGPDRLLAVSDAVDLAGTGDGLSRLGGLDVEVKAGQCRLVSNGQLAGSVIALDTSLRNLVLAGLSLPDAVAAVSGNPLRLLGITDRGRIAVGLRADLVELDDDLRVRRVMRGGRWFASPPGPDDPAPASGVRPAQSA